MKSLRLLRTKRAVGVAALIGVATVATSACDSSPYAAQVNGHTISQTTLTTQLRGMASNSDYVKWVAAYASESQSDLPEVMGAAPGTYSSGWTAEVLGDLIQDRVIRQHLDATHNLPSSAQLSASRAIESAVYTTAWAKFSATVRDQFVQRNADLALFESTSSLSTSSVTQLKEEIPGYLFSQICLRTESATSAAQASTLAQGMTSSAYTSCYSQPQFEQLPVALQTEVLKLDVGKSAAVKLGTDQYSALQVVSRKVSFSNAQIAVAYLAAGTQVGAKTPPAAVTALLAKADVKVDPMYGTWEHSTTGYGVTSTSSS